MQKVDDLINNAKYLVFNRNTWYSNQFPYNCLYVHENGSISGDCIGLIKGLINRPDIVKCFNPGQYAKPGTVMPDLSERGIYDQCTQQSKDFRKLFKGAYLEMDMIVGHAGLYVGEFTDGGIVNTIECTTDFIGGVTTSYVNEYGQRFDHKGGTYSGLSWERFGKLSKWITYEKPWIKWINGGWYLVDNGVIDYSYTGVAQNENGWWRVEKGKVNFDFTGLAQNEYGWWMIENGKVNFDFTGLCVNQYGTWKITKGKVDFDFSGEVMFSGSKWKIKNGKVV